MKYKHVFQVKICILTHNLKSVNIYAVYKLIKLYKVRMFGIIHLSINIANKYF